MFGSLARPIRPCRMFLFVASQVWLQLPSHPRSPVRSCLRLVLCQSELSFGILSSLRLPVSHRGLIQQRMAPHKLMPVPGVPKKCTRVADRAFPDGESPGRNRVISDVRGRRLSLRRVGIYAEGVAHRSPGSRSAPWVMSRLRIGGERLCNQY